MGDLVPLALFCRTWDEADRETAVKSVRNSGSGSLSPPLGASMKQG